MTYKSIGVIGAGNMGSAIVRGMLRRKLFRPSNVWVFDVLSEKSRNLARELKVKCATDERDLARRSDVILLAVKPQNLQETARGLAPLLKRGTGLLTILAGGSTQSIKKHFGAGFPVVRAMPNLAATVGEAVTAITGDKKLIPLARRVFEACGQVMDIPENLFHAVTALSGSGPAYYFYLMELAANEARRLGFSDADARLLAKQTAKGAALVASVSPASPGELREQVTSKGGTTEAALRVLNEKRFPEIFSEAIQAAVHRGEELGKGGS